MRGGCEGLGCEGLGCERVGCERVGCERADLTHEVGEQPPHVEERVGEGRRVEDLLEAGEIAQPELTAPPTPPTCSQ